MKAKEKEHVVNYLLTQMSNILLAKSPIKDALQKAAQSHENRLRHMFTPEELEPIQIMRDSIVKLAHKLANCMSTEDLQHVHNFIEDLNKDEVMIAIADEETGEVTGYEQKQSS